MNAVIKQRLVAAFRVTGHPKGQPRPRAFVRGKRAAVYDPGTAEGWKSQVAVAAKEFEGVLFTQCLSVSLLFHMPRPKSHFRTNGALTDRAPRFLCDRKPDADNLAKAVLDALTALRVWLDDDQVVTLKVDKFWQPDQRTAPGCQVRIHELIEMEA